MAMQVNLAPPGEHPRRPCGRASLCPFTPPARQPALTAQEICLPCDAK